VPERHFRAVKVPFVSAEVQPSFCCDFSNICVSSSLCSLVASSDDKWAATGRQGKTAEL
jgi:hypothetical protein